MFEVVTVEKSGMHDAPPLFSGKKKLQEKETRLQCKERLINKSRN